MCRRCDPYPDRIVHLFECDKSKVTLDIPIGLSQKDLRDLLYLVEDWYLPKSKSIIKTHYTWIKRKIRYRWDALLDSFRTRYFKCLNKIHWIWVRTIESRVRNWLLKMSMNRIIKSSKAYKRFKSYADQVSFRTFHDVAKHKYNYKRWVQ